MEGDICKAQPLYRFNESDGETCVGDMWQPYVINMGCSPSNALPPAACSDAECNQTCDHWWPWEKWELTIGREGDPPEKLEYCPSETRVKCPPCTTTTTTSTPTSGTTGGESVETGSTEEEEDDDDDMWWVIVNLAIQGACLVASLVLAVAVFVLMG